MFLFLRLQRKRRLLREIARLIDLIHVPGVLYPRLHSYAVVIMPVYVSLVIHLYDITVGSGRLFAPAASCLAFTRTFDLLLNVNFILCFVPTPLILRQNSCTRNRQYVQAFAREVTWQFLNNVGFPVERLERKLTKV